uniref:Uncharacterized protein n=1 Tax=Oryza brachyantha TaxID=4533 RepID=J3LXU0_ORYBR
MILPYFSTVIILLNHEYFFPYITLLHFSAINYFTYSQCMHYVFCLHVYFSHFLKTYLCLCSFKPVKLVIKDKVFINHLTK